MGAALGIAPNERRSFCAGTAWRYDRQPVRLGTVALTLRRVDLGVVGVDGDTLR